jgi:outer membrane protein assembly factor BamA
MVMAVRRIPQLALASACCAALGCATLPRGRIAVDKVEFTGNEEIGSHHLEEKIATRASSRFLLVFEGVLHDYQLFNRHVLERDLQRIERYYRARGYYEARARAGRVFATDKDHVKVEVVVEEGQPVLLRRVDIHGLETLPPLTALRAREAVDEVLALAEPFDEEEFEKAANQLKRELTNRGHAYAKVDRAADVNVPRHAASAGFWVVPGPITRYGTVTIEGLDGIPEGPVRRALDINPGDAYSTKELEQAEQALLGLGVFSSVEIAPVLPREGQAQPERVPLRVMVKPARLHAVHAGGGLQIDTLKTDLHVTGGWESRNFLGGLRRFQVELTPGFVLYPTRIPTFEVPERLLPQARVRTELRQPGLFEARANGFLRGEASIYPVLLSAEHDESAPILGYRDLRAGIGWDRTIWKLYGALSQNFQLISPFTYLGQLDPDLSSVLVSYPELTGSLDLRDDRIHPHQGAYFANTLQVAGLGGDAQDVKVQPEARAYLPLAEDVTLGARGSFGLLFPGNYGDTLVPNAFAGNSGNESRAEWVQDVQILFLRGFFAGGSSSNRGYGGREIGPHGVVPFYNPGQTEGDIVLSCDPASPDYSAGSCDLPLGGLTLWEASLELRYPIERPLFGVVFVDTADVAPRRVQFRFDRPHLSAGAGLRYDTPVGPIRVDAGYRIPGLQAPDSPDELAEPSTLLGLPIALSFGIGESF